MSKKINAFARAKQSDSIYAALEVTDVMAASPGWTHEQAAAFLAKHAQEIGDAMALCGVQSMFDLLRSEESHVN